MQSGRRCGSGVGVGVSNFGALLIKKQGVTAFRHLSLMSSFLQVNQCPVKLGSKL